MSEYITPEFLHGNPLTTDRDDLPGNTWQPVGLVARRLVRRLGVPPSTGVLVLESAGINLNTEA